MRPKSSNSLANLSHLKRRGSEWSWSSGWDFVWILVFTLVFLCSCSKGGGLALKAERAAPMGGEFLRFYKDGTVIYGFAVVKENIKAQGNYRYAHDTLYFLNDSFTPHFPEGCLTVRGDTLYMVNGLHFKVTENNLKP